MSSNGQRAIPAYQKIQESIRERIDGGDLKPGDAVASERELARVHRVSLMTARHALAGLEREGVVERPSRAPEPSLRPAHSFQQIDELYRANGEPGTGRRIESDRSQNHRARG